MIPAPDTVYSIRLVTTGINMMGNYAVELSVLILMCVGLVAAFATFIQIQVYLEDPKRKQRNAEWFKKFRANLEKEYSKNDELAWRYYGLERHFHKESL